MRLRGRGREVRCSTYVLHRAPAPPLRISVLHFSAVLGADDQKERRRCSPVGLHPVVCDVIHLKRKGWVSID